MTSLLDSRHACSNVQLDPADFTIHTPLQSMAGRSAIFLLQSIRRSFRAVSQIEEEDQKTLIHLYHIYLF